MTSVIQYYGTGRRKTATARVRLVPGTGQVSINRRTMEDYVGGRHGLSKEIFAPFQAADAMGRFGRSRISNGWWHLRSNWCHSSWYRQSFSGSSSAEPSCIAYRWSFDQRRSRQRTQKIRTQTRSQTFSILETLERICGSGFGWTCAL